MSADTRYSGPVTGRVTKIYRIRDFIVGFCGDLAAAMQAISWLRDPTVNPEPTSEQMEGVELVVLKSDGIWFYEGCLRPYLVDDDVAAIGSGAQGALVALNLGCTTREAVKAAMDVDAYTGGDVDTLELEGTQG